MNITYGILYNVFQVLDTDDDRLKQIIPCLSILLKKSENDIANIIQKLPWEIIYRFLRRREKIKAYWTYGFFLPKSRITTYTYPNFKIKFLFNNGSHLEIRDYFRFRWNTSFTAFFIIFQNSFYSFAKTMNPKHEDLKVMSTSLVNHSICFSLD